MACFHPLRAWRARVPGSNGRYGVVFNHADGSGQELELPCGQCIGCRLDKAKEWSLRCVHEAELHEENCFVTLTYDDEHLPRDLSLDVGHFQKFMKRLRKRISPRKVRYYHCGEYGDQNRRPHYHALLFGYDYPDRESYGNQDFSELLARDWGKGFCTIGDVTLESCRYVARYVTKKITGDMKDEHYWSCDAATGEMFTIKPEYATMSRRPGIGRGWLEKYGSDVYPAGYVVHDGASYSAPRYYDEWKAGKDPELIEELKAKRRAKIDFGEQTEERRAVREEVMKQKYKVFNGRLKNDF